MPLNTRDLWLILKAQDQTNRALNAFSRNVRNAGNQVRAAQLEAAKAASLGTIAQAKLANEMHRAEIGQLAAQKAALKHAYVQAQLQGASAGVTTGIKNQVNAIDQHVIRLRGQVANNNAVIASEKVRLQQTQDSIKQLQAYNKSVQDTEKNLSHLSGRLQSVAQTATAAGFAMSAAGALTIMGLKKTIDTAAEYDRQVRATATQIDKFSGNLDELADIGRRLARDIAVPFQEIQPALFDIFSSMEVSVPEAEKLLRSFSKAAVAGQVSIQDVSRATIGLLNAFQRPASDVNRLLDIQFQLIQEGIGTYEEWNQRIGLVSPSAIRAGQSIETMMAALAASTRFGISAARSGTAVARAFDALSNPKAVEQLKKLGVAVVDAKGNFRPFNEVLGEFRAALLKLPEKGRFAEIEKILEVFKGAGGTIEARRFLQAILLEGGNLELFNDVLKEMSSSTGSLEKAYGLMADSVSAKSQLLSNQWEMLKEGVGRALIPTFIRITEWLTNLVDKFNQLSPATKKTIAMFALGVGVFLSIVGPLLLLVGVVAAFAAAFAVAGTAIVAVVAGIAGLILILAGAAAGFYALFKNSEGFRNLLGNLRDQFNELKDAAVDIARKIGDAWDKYMAGPLGRVWQVINERVIPALASWQEFVASRVVPVIKEAGRILGDILAKAFQVIGDIIDQYVVPAISRMVQWWNDHKQTLMPLISILAQVVKWLLIIVGVIIGVLVVALLGPVVAAIAVVVAAFATIIAIITYTIEWIQKIWGKIKEFVAIIIDGFAHLDDAVKYYWNGIWYAIMNFVNRIRDGVRNGFNTARAAAANAFESIRAAVMEKIEAAKNAVSNAIAAIRGFFSNAGSWLMDAGRNLMEGLINGIRSKVDVIKGYIREVASMIRGAFPFSPAKWGPLSGMGSMINAGKNVANMLAQGMLSQVGTVRSATATLAGQISGYTTPDNAYNAGTAGAGPRIINQNITVNTQEIDPRRQSAQLGWELARMV